MIANKEWAVEAAQILAHWANKEEYHNVILRDIGMTSILELLHVKPQTLIHPFMSLALDRLIQKDSAKIIIIKEGGVSGLTALLSLDEHCKSPIISRFVSRSFAAIAEIVVCKLLTNNLFYLIIITR